MKIIQTILVDTDLFIFTETPSEDLEYFIKKYNDGTSQIHLGYEIPNIEVFKFLGNDYNCIHLWYDNECDIAHDCKVLFDRITNL